MPNYIICQSKSQRYNGKKMFFLMKIITDKTGCGSRNQKFVVGAGLKVNLSVCYEAVPPYISRFWVLRVDFGHLRIILDLWDSILVSGRFWVPGNQF